MGRQTVAVTGPSRAQPEAEPEGRRRPRAIQFFCCICGKPIVDPLDYVQLKAHIPGHSAYQVVSAHLSCLQPVLHSRFRLDEDILFDR